MNQKLAALLTVFGLAGGIVLLQTVRSGVTDAELRDAGIAIEHVLVSGRCEVLLKDGGYETRSGSVWANRDGGSVILDQEDVADVREIIRCRNGGAGGANKTRLSKIDGECACRASSGTCRRTGNVDLLFGRIAGPGYPAPFDTFSGAGCIRMQCRESGGRSVWPSNCPREDAGVRVR